MGGKGSEYVSGLARSPLTGRLVVSGRFNAGVMLAGSLRIPASASYDSFAVELMADGNQTWAYTWGNSNLQNDKGAAVGASGRVYQTVRRQGLPGVGPLSGRSNTTPACCLPACPPVYMMVCASGIYAIELGDVRALYQPNRPLQAAERPE